MKRTFVVEFEMVFDADDLEDDCREDELEEIRALTLEQLKDAVDGGFEYDSFDFFGESLATLGLLIPKVTSVTEKHSI